jgi:hypothetical protein
VPARVQAPRPRAVLLERSSSRRAGRVSARVRAPIATRTAARETAVFRTVDDAAGTTARAGHRAPVSRTRKGRRTATVPLCRAASAGTVKRRRASRRVDEAASPGITGEGAGVRPGAVEQALLPWTRAAVVELPSIGETCIVHECQRVDSDDSLTRAEQSGESGREPDRNHNRREAILRTRARTFHCSLVPASSRSCLCP